MLGGSAGVLATAAAGAVAAAIATPDGVASAAAAAAGNISVAASNRLCPYTIKGDSRQDLLPLIMCALIMRFMILSFVYILL